MCLFGTSSDYTPSARRVQYAGQGSRISPPRREVVVIEGPRRNNAYGYNQNRDRDRQYIDYTPNGHNRNHSHSHSYSSRKTSNGSVVYSSPRGSYVSGGRRVVSGGEVMPVVVERRRIVY